MPIIRATMFFENLISGWTESYFLDGASTDLKTYFAKADALSKKRIKISGGTTYLPYVRISQEGVFRDAYNYAYTGYGLRGVASEPSDYPSTCLEIRWANDTETKHKLTFARGVWDSVITGGGVYTPSSAFNANMGAFAGQIIADKWGWLGASASNTQNIVAMAQNLDGTVRVTVANPLFPNTPGVKLKLSLSGLTSPGNMNGPGVFRIVSTTVVDSVPRVSIFPWTVGGQVRYTTSAFVEAANYVVWKVGERKVGRPSFGPVGRRRARARS